MSHMPVKLLALVIVLILISIGAFFIFKPTQSLNLTKPQNIAKEINPSPTPMPFYELTIPYLRSKEYKSTLGELEEYSENESYESFLTNYDSDRLEVNGLITVPKTTMPKGGHPAIVFVHGYIPPTQYQTTTRYLDHVDYLARNGFVVFKIDLRGHGSSEGEAGGGYYSSDYVIDTLNARAALQSSDFVNKDKIGLWGHSMAGNVLMRAFAAKPEIPGVVIWAGAVYSYEDQRKYGISDNSFQPSTISSRRQSLRRQLFEKYGSPSASVDFWRMVAPTSYLNDLKGAVEIHHSVDDDVVNIGYSRDLNALLDKTSVEHELHEYPSGGHNISGDNFNLAMQQTVDFFKLYLK